MKVLPFSAVPFAADVCVNTPNIRCQPANDVFGTETLASLTALSSRSFASCVVGSDTIDPRELIFSRILENHAAPGSAFRRFLAREVPVMIRADDAPNVERLLGTILGAVQNRIESAAREPERLRLEPCRYGWLLPKLVGLLTDAEARGLVRFTERHRAFLNLFRTLASQPDADWGRDAALRAFAVDAGLGRALADAFASFPGDRRVNVAVVGYGLNLDAIAFFLDLGFSVTGVEKRDSAHGWKEVGAVAALPEHARFCRAIGLPDALETPATWPQLTETEAGEILGHRARRDRPRWADADSPSLGKGTFDAVVVPAIVDEALATVASLARPGGYVLADHYVHPAFRKTADAASFAEAASGAATFRTVYEEKFTSRRKILPSNYNGDHRVYLLQRDL